MAFTALEVIALIFAIGIIVKLVMFLFAKSTVKNMFDWWMKRANLLMLIYIIGIIIFGYYVFRDMSVIQVVAAGMFILCLMGLTLISSDKNTLKKVGKKMISKAGVKKTIVIWILWVALAVWVLYVLFT